uniref:Uncharacterized protein n=1 Tax=Arundo donax TaxID=35708 RepID=A0A0A8YFC8_ARUDO
MSRTRHWSPAKHYIVQV